MKFVLSLIATSALFTAAAIPMQSPKGSSFVPDHDYVPKVTFGNQNMYSNDKTSAKDIIINHYKSLEPEDDRKGARLAFAKKGWRDGGSVDDEHMQYLAFDYRRGDTPDSAKIGQTVMVSRDRPPPEAHFSRSVPKEHRVQIAKEIDTKFKALHPDQAKRVRSMKTQNDWADGSGLREETQFTYHHSVIPTAQNILWDPVTIYRPMSFLVDGAVPEKEVPAIKKRIREEHEKLAEDHPLKKANYGVVTQGWHMDTAVNGRMVVGTTLYKVKDQLTVSAEEDYERIGDFNVPLGKGRRPETSGPSTSSRT